MPLNTTLCTHTEPSPCGTPAPTPRLPPLHGNSLLAGACLVSQSRGAGSAACTCPGAFTNCILLWLQPPRQKNILGFRNQHLESPWSVHMKPRQQGPSTLSALGPPSQLILSPRRCLQTQPHPQPHVLRTLSKQVSGHDCCMQCCLGNTEHHGFHVLEH